MRVPNLSQIHRKRLNSAVAPQRKWHNFRIANGFRENWHGIKLIGPTAI
jgi:hypothetical protein